MLFSNRANVSTEYVLELLKYNDKRELHDKLLTSPMPRMPINRIQLAEKCIPARKYLAEIHDKLNKIWCENNFKITVEELLNRVPEVLIEVEEEQRNPPPSASKKKKQWRKKY